MKTHREISKLLRAHLDAGGTINDSTTDDLYREWHGITDGSETDLETVELWAVENAATFSEPKNDALPLPQEGVVAEITEILNSVPRQDEPKNSYYALRDACRQALLVLDKDEQSEEERKAQQACAKALVQADREAVSEAPSALAEELERVKDALETLVNVHDDQDDGGDGITEDDWEHARRVLGMRKEKE
jgi:hypothetical protein